jgi:PI-3-kinase-related kinase SMG-1
LPTKTKPKKISFSSPDGQVHSYLLKGREDLHLDERIMQFLAFINQFLRADRHARARSLTARHYAVIPLSDRAGLIQWVEGNITLFQIYKQWQKRELLHSKVAVHTYIVNCIAL